MILGAHPATTGSRSPRLGSRVLAATGARAVPSSALPGAALVLNCSAVRIAVRWLRIEEECGDDRSDLRGGADDPRRRQPFNGASRVAPGLCRSEAPRPAEIGRAHV